MPFLPGPKRFFSFPQRPHRLSRPPGLPSNENFPGVKHPGRNSDHTSPHSVEIKRALSYTATPPYCLDAVLN